MSQKELAFDITRFRENYGDSREDGGVVVKIFLDSYSPALDRMRNALAVKNAAEFGKAAHALKGVLLQIFAMPASTSAARLEVLGRSGDLTAALPLFEKLEAQIVELVAELKDVSDG